MYMLIIFRANLILKQLQIRSFIESAILNFFLEKKMLHSHRNQNGWVEILMFSLVSRKFFDMRNITLYSVDAETIVRLYILFCGVCQ